MEKKDNNQPGAGLSRREFLGGVVAGAGILAAGKASAQSSLPVYQDSFGNIAPAAGDALSLGVYPPPAYTGQGATSVTPGYAQPNILLIMVDQLRAQKWLPAAGQAAVDQLTPNIAWDHSFNFPNYFVAATNCSPSRASMLTGLYSQQTFMFRTQDTGKEPPLQTTFPTFGAALSQVAGYQTCWIGKWHLSDGIPGYPGSGTNGPGDYGFTATNQNLPPNSSIASPNGCPNQGTTGNNSSPEFGNGTLTPPVTVSGLTTPPFPMVSDGAIANWFIEQWLPSAPRQTPWFAAVSFLNPHDICVFPYSFGLSGSSTAFGSPTNAQQYGYQPPPVAGYPYAASDPDDYVPPLNASLYATTNDLPPNFSDRPSSQPYGVQSSNGWGKPGFQAYFQLVLNAIAGSINTSNGWITFLNYYFWLQSCADYQIGRVLNSLSASQFAANTIIIFTSDHGDFGASHGMRTKGGGLYDEAINVPLYVSFPMMRPPYAPAPTRIIRTFACSSVDMFAFLYTLALGNSGWRNNTSDSYVYLNGRECIVDAIFSTSPAQRRLSPFLKSDGSGYQPYVLHTTDEFPSAFIPGSNPQVAQPSHAIGYRTVDTSVTTRAGGSTFYGGAKLGIYSYWPCGASTPDTTKQQQFEFYNYTAGNIAETGNSALISATQLDTLPSQYLAAYNSIAATELYGQYSQVQSAGSTASAAYFAYMQSVGLGC